MRFMAIKRMKNKIRKKLSGQTGFSLGELLAATLILLLASQVLAQGITFAVRMYNESLTISHGKQLCSTLTNVVETELRYTTSIKIDSSNTLQNYFSPTYGQTKSSFSVIDSEGNLTNKYIWRGTGYTDNRSERQAHLAETGFFSKLQFL